MDRLSRITISHNSLYKTNLEWFFGVRFVASYALILSSTNIDQVDYITAGVNFFALASAGRGEVSRTMRLVVLASLSDLIQHGNILHWLAVCGFSIGIYLRKSVRLSYDPAFFCQLILTLTLLLDASLRTESNDGLTQAMKKTMYTLGCTGILSWAFLPRVKNTGLLFVIILLPVLYILSKEYPELKEVDAKGKEVHNVVDFFLAFCGRYQWLILSELIVSFFGVWFGLKKALVDWQNSTKLRFVLGRKFFHILCLALASPQIFPEYTVCMAFAWSILMYIYFMEEALRLRNAFGLNTLFKQKLFSLIDIRDQEGLMVTPMHLCMGVASGVWLSSIHNGKCFSVPTLGLIAACVGDSFAGIIGTRFGRVPMPCSPTRKTFEGFLAYLTSYALGTMIVTKLTGKSLRVLYYPIAVSDIASALTETYSSRVDNFWVSYTAIVSYLLVERCC